MPRSKSIRIGCWVMAWVFSAVSWASYSSESADNIGRRQMRELDINNRPSFSSSKLSIANNVPGSAVTSSGPAKTTTGGSKTQNNEPYEVPKAGSHLDNFKDAGSSGVRYR